MPNNKYNLPADFTVTAHTGCLNSTANTVESMITGFEAGADIIEIDIRFLKDGTPVLSHNPIKPGSESKYVRLRDAFICLKDYPDKKANLDIKMTANMPEIERLAKETGVLNQIFFTGIDRTFVEAAKKGCPEIPYYLNIVTSGLLKFSRIYSKHLVKVVKVSGAVGINTNKPTVSKSLVEIFHKNNLLVSVWTITNKDEAEKYLSMSPDNITSKNPDDVIALSKNI